MTKTMAPNPLESEYLELETVASALERTPKLVKLLRYLVEKHFAGEDDYLREYNIATEVFGRDKTTFIASEDAVARVETHRLRKKLKSYYEREGRDHRVKISIPLGTYAPVFIREGSPDLVEETFDLAEQDRGGTGVVSTKTAEPVFEPCAEPQMASPSHIAPTLSKGRKYVVWTSSAVLLGLLLLFGVYLTVRRQHTQMSGSSALNSAPGAAGQPGTSASPVRPQSVAIPFRMIAGYSGPTQRDSMGDVWQAEQYYRNGWAVHQPTVYLSRTSDPLIFRYGRSGNFDYDIPLGPGTYELHLYFLDASATFQPEDAENLTSFNVTMNGTIALANFDIDSDAEGRNIADERVFRDVTPAADGKLHLHFSTVTGTPSLSAIQILSGTPHKQLPVRLITQARPFTDRNGRLWRPDNYFLGGRILFHDAPSSDPSDTDFIPTERFGHFSYAIPVDPHGRYTVTLHFAELFWGVESPDGAGKRIFRVMCNGSTLLDDFDIYKEVGADRPLVKSFHHLRPTAQGKLNLVFEPITTYATVSAIEVVDESE